MLATNRNLDTVLDVSTGGSATAVSTYLRLLVDRCVESGAMFVAGPPSDSHQFDGVALWGPPRDDWLPWCVHRTLYSVLARAYLGSPREEEEFLSQLRQEKRDWITHHVRGYLLTSETIVELQVRIP